MAESVKKSTTKSTAPKTRKAPAQKAASNVESIQKSGPTHDQVAELARKYWAERGYKDGHHEEDWFRAEQELRGKAS